jgi:hypothetical protein
MSFIATHGAACHKRMMLDVIALAGIMSQDGLAPRSHLASIQEEDSLHPAVYRHEDEDVFAAHE